MLKIPVYKITLTIFFIHIIIEVFELQKKKKKKEKEVIKNLEKEEKQI